jgi:3-oxoacyl-(acyl-carrier-protein) synthase
MHNNYFTQVAPYFQQQDQGLMPVFQNIAQQQANQNAALQQQMQNNQMAGQTQGSGMGGMNPLAMAAMLRGKSTTPATYTGPSYGTNPNFSNSYFDKMSFD